MRRSRFSLLFAFTLLAAAAAPLLVARREGARMMARLDALGSGALAANGTPHTALPPPDPTYLVRVEALEPLLASWQTIGGCGAGAGSGSGTGIKWIGRNVSGGLFNVQEQVSYSKLGTVGYPEYDYFANTLITADVGDKWNFGVNVPLVYKYLNDPFHFAPQLPAINYSNGGLGDISLLATRKLGAINATTLTGIVGVPTGTSDAVYPGSMTLLNQNAQLGFGRPTGTLILDHTMDQVWGLIVVGGLAGYRGGKNTHDSYRAPIAAAYGYAGYFLGPLVPAFGLTLSGSNTHDRDQNSTQNTPLAALSANFSIEWSSPWVAVLLAGSIPYKYDGVRTDDSGNPGRSPWGFLPWTLALGVSTAPF